MKRALANDRTDPVLELAMSTYRLVSSIFPDRTSRWVNDACRRGAIPHAVKIGGSWFLLDRDVARLGSDAPRVPTIEDADAILRARGIL